MASPNKKKILKNTINAPIELSQIGLTIPALGQITIEPGMYYIIANEIGLTPAGQLDTLIANGSIVVNDGVHDLTVAEGILVDRAIDYLKYPDTAFNIRFLSESERPNGFAANNVQEAIEEARSTIEGKISVLPTFLNNGLTSGKWLSLDGSMGGSDVLPSICTYDSKLAGLTYININNGSNLDIEFYKNGITASQLVFTWQIRNKRHAWKTNSPLNTVLFLSGDRISCFARGVAGTSARDVVINLFVQSTNSVGGEGGAATGIT
jgi:hypothetical protein